jgi:uncharacterized protein YndB with AHSA1/START domain
MTRADVLVHELQRMMVIEADRETVFRFFTDPARWAAWWGPGSTIDPRVGGRVLIRYPGGTEATGEIAEIEPPERLVFTYGYVTGTPIPPGASRVTIHLAAHGTGTRLDLTHAFADAAVRDDHVQGWRYQLSLFANVVANELHQGASVTVDRWFSTWSEPDRAARDSSLKDIATNTIRMRDPYSAIEGIPDLLEHLTASHRFMPGMRLQRDGDVRHCQGTILSDWVARTADGQERARGTNVFVLDSAGRIQAVTGFWTPPKQQGQA